MDWYESFSEEFVKRERIQLLLETAIDLLDDMKSYVPDYFLEKWDYDTEITNIKNQLEEIAE